MCARLIESCSHIISVIERARCTVDGVLKGVAGVHPVQVCAQLHVKLLSCVQHIVIQSEIFIAAIIDPRVNICGKYRRGQASSCGDYPLKSASAIPAPNAVFFKPIQGTEGGVNSLRETKTDANQRDTRKKLFFWCPFDANRLRNFNPPPTPSNAICEPPSPPRGGMHPSHTGRTPLYTINTIQQ